MYYTVILINDYVHQLTTVADPRAVGLQQMDLTVPAKQTLPVYVTYCPTHPHTLTGKVVMRPTDGGAIKYAVSPLCPTHPHGQGPHEAH